MGAKGVDCARLRIRGICAAAQKENVDESQIPDLRAHRGRAGGVPGPAAPCRDAGPYGIGCQPDRSWTNSVCAPGRATGPYCTTRRGNKRNPAPGTALPTTTFIRRLMRAGSVRGVQAEDLVAPCASEIYVAWASIGTRFCEGSYRGRCRSGREPSAPSGPREHQVLAM